MKLVVIYGPPGSGKFTVGSELADLTGFKLFHNHLTVNAVRTLFEFGSPEFSEALWRVRLDLISDATRHRVNTIMTLSPARGPSLTFEQRLTALEHRVKDHGGEILFVHLEPSKEVLEERVLNPSRAALGKLMNVGRLREIMGNWDSQPLDQDHLSIDNSFLPAADVAKSIAAHYRLPPAPD